jgi:hypothetical protein
METTVAVTFTQQHDSSLYSVPATNSNPSPRVKEIFFRLQNEQGLPVRNPELYCNPFVTVEMLNR